MATNHKHEVIVIHYGEHESELTDLYEQILVAQAEEQSEPARFGTKSKALELAKKYDARKAQVEEFAIKATLWQVSYLQWGPLADIHVPREGDVLDRQQALNRKTFPKDLLKISLIEPSQIDGSDSIEDLIAKGATVLAGLGALSQPQYVRLETAAWNLSTGDDSLPKQSLVSLLKQQRDLDSRQQLDSE